MAPWGAMEGGSRVPCGHMPWPLLNGLEAPLFPRSGAFLKHGLGVHFLFAEDFQQRGVQRLGAEGFAQDFVDTERGQAVHLLV